LLLLKKHIKGIHFVCDKEVKADTGKWFEEQPEEFYTDGLEKFVQRWRCSVELEDHYVASEV
jgi:hypothetical protein